MISRLFFLFRKERLTVSKFDTKCIQEGYKPKSGEPRVLPIVQSTTYKYDSAREMGDLFDLKAEGYFYTRLANPTVAAVEEKLAALEGGVGCMMTSSGQSATFSSILTICGAGDHIVSSAAIYGGSFNLLGVSFAKLGIEVTFIAPDSTEEQIQNAIRPNTKLIFGEVLANPSLAVLDIETYAKVAHANKIPLIVDNTFPTPYNCRPIEFGADIVVHSTSKYLDGHAVSLGGAVIDSGNFDWTCNEKFKAMYEPDASYHGVIYTESFGKSAYIQKAKTQLMRDYGCMMSPQNAFLLNLGMETLALRMERHNANGLAVAKYLSQNEKVTWVSYPGLENDKNHALASKYLKGCSGVVSFGVKGGREAATKVMESLKLAAIVTHVADARTCVLHPASTTHRQLTDEQLIECGVTPDLIRFSNGIEAAEDIIADLEQALEQV